ncbi:MAG: FAD-dependent oxidoreductase [Acidobacteria bacterium]|nr:FAD-dependent oxidoreductase [Acidobacteriota bacterium]
MEKFDVILVGGGPATRILNKHLHIYNPDISTAVFRSEERIVNHCGTPYIVEGEIPWEKGLINEKIVTQWGTPIIKEAVVGGNPKEKTIITESGRQYQYGKLVFATGTDQIIPPLEGRNLGNILKVRKTKDLQQATDLLHTLKRIVVLGGGYIGLEFAVSLKNMGKEVTLIELKPHVLGNRVDTEFSEILQTHLRNFGIEMWMGKKAIRFTGEDTVNGVMLENGQLIKTDAVLSAVGVRPLVDYAEKFGLRTTRNGIVTNEYFETGIPDVYAVGDCVETRSFLTGKPTPGKLGSNAGQMARILGMNLSGHHRAYEGVINVVVTRFCGISYGATGLSEADAVEAGIEVLTAKADSTDIYANMPGVNPVKVKVLYRKSDLKLMGSEMIGNFNPAGYLESATQMIRGGFDLYDVLASHYSSHPELTPKTSHSYLVFASELILKQLVKN